MASQVPKPRARRASRVPLGKSLSVDENALSGQQHLVHPSAGFGRPSSMLARASSSSGAVLNTANANAQQSAHGVSSTNGLAQRMKASSLSQGGAPAGKMADNNKAGGASAGPRRALGDISNATKVAEIRGGKDAIGAVKDVKAGIRSRSATASSLSSKPLTAKVPISSVHSRTGSAASRHSVISQKSSQSSLHAAAGPVNAARARTHSDNASVHSLPSNAAAPGAPRIGSGQWNAPLKKENEDEEVLDTVVEGDSFSGGSSSDGNHGLGIRYEDEEEVKVHHGMEEDLVDQMDEQHHAGNSSNDTFELDLDPAFEDVKAGPRDDGMQVDGARPPGIPQYEDEYDAAARQRSRVQSPAQKVSYTSARASTSAAAPTAPKDWLALTNTAQRVAERQIQDIVEVFDDKADFMDISMVAEYNEEIFAYMEELEIESMPNPDYIKNQQEIEWPMRATLIDWLLQVHMRYHMLPETLWITINIVDRFLSSRVVSLVKLQLVGITAMFVAAKYEEIMAPSVDEFVYMTENNYSREEILKGERIILATLDFKISNYCSPYSWMRRISKADEYDVQTRTLSKFLMEVTLLDHRFLRCKPSTIAAVGMYLARRMLGGDWNEAFIYYSRHTETQLAQPTSLVLSAIAAEDFEEKFVYQKYSVKKHLKASIFARQWARATLESATRAQELSR